ncbi:hypothetical protein DCAR_0104120 [Daucus carota subsp. sativus]|uniref:Uncharacterized protein n=1 Tax=Daucus carota subsp. sativus TaxID=79200 RepID=A0A166IKH3_DAUCS|nr:hypothetical protein DCAR_0104120 [Daucus carota subsp. sativus]
MALASQTLILRNPTFASPNISSLAVTTGIAFTLFSSRISRRRNDNYFSPKPNFYKPHNLTYKNPSKPYTLSCSSNINSSTSPLTEPTRPSPEDQTRQNPSESTRQVFTESTRTVSTLVATVILLSKLLGHAIAKRMQGVCKIPSPNQLLSFQENMINTTSPLFFAAVRIHRQQLQTPWTIMASGLARCLEVYMALLGIRVTLSFFPNVEWNRQPYSGLRDLCDPFILLFQNIIPPLFNVDMSVTVAFTVLSVLVEILTPRLF